jgi:hypothetical protein
MSDTHVKEEVGDRERAETMDNETPYLYCKVAKEMADRPSVLLPSFSLSSFPLSLPIFTGSSLKFLLSHAPLISVSMIS